MDGIPPPPPPPPQQQAHTGRSSTTTTTTNKHEPSNTTPYSFEEEDEAWTEMASGGKHTRGRRIGGPYYGGDGGMAPPPQVALDQWGPSMSSIGWRFGGMFWQITYYGFRILAAALLAIWEIIETLLSFKRAALILLIIGGITIYFQANQDEVYSLTSYAAGVFDTVYNNWIADLISDVIFCFTPACEIISVFTTIIRAIFGVISTAITEVVNVIGFTVSVASREEELPHLMNEYIAKQLGPVFDDIAEIAIRKYQDDENVILYYNETDNEEHILYLDPFADRDQIIDIDESTEDCPLGYSRILIPPSSLQNPHFPYHHHDGDNIGGGGGTSRQAQELLFYQKLQRGFHDLDVLSRYAPDEAILRLNSTTGTLMVRSCGSNPDINSGVCTVCGAINDVVGIITSILTFAVQTIEGFWIVVLGCLADVIESAISASGAPAENCPGALLGWAEGILGGFFDIFGVTCFNAPLSASIVGCICGNSKCGQTPTTCVNGSKTESVQVPICGYFSDNCTYDAATNTTSCNKVPYTCKNSTQYETTNITVCNVVSQSCHYNHTINASQCTYVYGTKPGEAMFFIYEIFNGCFDIPCSVVSDLADFFQNPISFIEDIAQNVGSDIGNAFGLRRRKDEYYDSIDRFAKSGKTSEDEGFDMMDGKEIQMTTLSGYTVTLPLRTTVQEAERIFGRDMIIKPHQNVAGQEWAKATPKPGAWRGLRKYSEIWPDDSTAHSDPRSPFDDTFNSDSRSMFKEHFVDFMTYVTWDDGDGGVSTTATTTHERNGVVKEENGAKDDGHLPVNENQNKPSSWWNPQVTEKQFESIKRKIRESFKAPVASFLRLLIEVKKGTAYAFANTASENGIPTKEEINNHTRRNPKVKKAAKVFVDSTVTYFKSYKSQASRDYMKRFIESVILEKKKNKTAAESAPPKAQKSTFYRTIAEIRLLSTILFAPHQLNMIKNELLYDGIPEDHIKEMEMRIFQSEKANKYREFGSKLREFIHRNSQDDEGGDIETRGLGRKIGKIFLKKPSMTYGVIIPLAISNFGSNALGAYMTILINAFEKIFEMPLREIFTDEYLENFATEMENATLTNLFYAVSMGVRLFLCNLLTLVVHMAKLIPAIGKIIEYIPKSVIFAISPCPPPPLRGVMPWTYVDNVFQCEVPTSPENTIHCTTSADCYGGGGFCKCSGTFVWSSLLINENDNEYCPDYSGICQCFMELDCSDIEIGQVHYKEYIDNAASSCIDVYGYNEKIVPYFDSNFNSRISSILNNTYIQIVFVLRSIQLLSFSHVLFTIPIMIMMASFSKGFTLLVIMVVINYLMPKFSNWEQTFFLGVAENFKNHGFWPLTTLGSFLVDVARFPNHTPENPAGSIRDYELFCFVTNLPSSFVGLPLIVIFISAIIAFFDTMLWLYILELLYQLLLVILLTMRDLYRAFIPSPLYDYDDYGGGKSISSSIITRNPAFDYISRRYNDFLDSRSPRKVDDPMDEDRYYITYIDDVTGVRKRKFVSSRYTERQYRARVDTRGALRNFDHFLSYIIINSVIAIKRTPSYLWAKGKDAYRSIARRYRRLTAGPKNQHHRGESSHHRRQNNNGDRRRSSERRKPSAEDYPLLSTTEMSQLDSNIRRRIPPAGSSHSSSSSPSSSSSSSAFNPTEMVTVVTSELPTVARGSSTSNTVVYQPVHHRLSGTTTTTTKEKMSEKQKQ